jgi:hypothetical protein
MAKKTLDAAEAIKTGTEKAQQVPVDGDRKILLKMSTGFGYSTPSEVHFTKRHPFQLVTQSEADILLKQDRFKLATREEVLAYYELS